MVGETVVPSIGSTIARTSGGSSATLAASASASGTLPSARKKACVSGVRRGGGTKSARCSTRRAARTSALSAIPGIDACPLRPWTRSRKGALIFSAVEQRKTGLPSTSTQSPPPSFTQKSVRTVSGCSWQSHERP